MAIVHGEQAVGKIGINHRHFGHRVSNYAGACHNGDSLIDNDRLSVEADKPVGTLVSDALLPGSRLFLLSTGTGLAPFLSIIRDPDIYDRFRQIILVHSVRRVSDLAFRDVLECQLAGDPLVQDQALVQFSYVPTVTRESFRNQGRISTLIDDGRLFDGVTGPRHFDPAIDRIMMCGSMAMIRDFAARFEAIGFEEGSNAKSGHFAIERAFVG